MTNLRRLITNQRSSNSKTSSHDQKSSPHDHIQVIIIIIIIIIIKTANQLKRWMESIIDSSMYSTWLEPLMRVVNSIEEKENT